MFFKQFERILFSCQLDFSYLQDCILFLIFFPLFQDIFSNQVHRLDYLDDDDDEDDDDEYDDDEEDYYDDDDEDDEFDDDEDVDEEDPEDDPDVKDINWFQSGKTGF